MIFSQFTADDIVVGRINQVSSGLFGSGSLYLSQSAFTTSSAQANTMIGAMVNIIPMYILVEISSFLLLMVITQILVAQSMIVLRSLRQIEF